MRELREIGFPPLRKNRGQTTVFARRADTEAHHNIHRVKEN